jgi:DsbC/DsbD-like thiol-disulfide interchange protein
MKKTQTSAPSTTAALTLSALLGLTLCGAVAAQTPGSANTVSWTVAPQAADAKPGGRTTITLQGAVQEGWHVYGLKQLPDGPTPLLVTLDKTDAASAAGAPTGSPPTKFHDPAFDLETQYYSKAFTVSLPVRVGPKLAAGRQQIPVSVRFQTCNGQICQPPKTVRLSAPITVRSDG